MYCLTHSVLAAPAIKRSFKKWMGKFYKFYRLIYSIFAFITLAFIFWYQFSIPGILLFSSKYNLIAGVLLAVPGICIMVISIYKYFYALSGIQALGKDEPEITLQQTGLHKFVRHPLYLGTLFFIWGLFLIFPFLSNLIACVVIHIYVLIGVRLEEKKLFIEYGEAYREYSRHVARLIPRKKIVISEYKNQRLRY